MSTSRANGKLLLTGEYVVLDGAPALALPTRLGQTLETSINVSDHTLRWSSWDADGSLWLELELNPDTWQVLHSNDEAAAARLAKVLRTAAHWNPAFRPMGEVHTRLEFPRRWGLGSSSTLMANIAAWAGVDAFDLLAATWGGSGYDVACAQAGGPILYQRLHGRSQWVEIPFRPAFAEQLWFVYLGQKQDSREGIRRYRERSEQTGSGLLDEIGALTMAAAAAAQLTDFEKILSEHERIIGSLLGLEPVQKSLFPDYQGVVKSLGAWGGDFVLATGPADATKTYFTKKGLDTVLGYGELMLGDAPAYPH